MTLKTDRATALDENARTFLMTFVEHVTMIVEDDGSHMAIVARVYVLLLAALTGGDGTTSAWQMLHRTIAETLENEHAARNSPSAYAYLRSFVRENRDLAHH